MTYRTFGVYHGYRIEKHGGVFLAVPEEWEGEPATHYSKTLEGCKSLIDDEVTGKQFQASIGVRES